MCWSWRLHAGSWVVSTLKSNLDPYMLGVEARCVTPAEKMMSAVRLATAKVVAKNAERTGTDRSPPPVSSAMRSPAFVLTGRPAA